MASIISRQQEINILDNIYKSSRAEFLAVYGRRRVGKTYLVSEYFKDKGIYFELTGIKEAILSEQLRNFATEFADVFSQGRASDPPTSWQNAFTLLRHEIAKITDNNKIILFFDELPWLASPRSNFLAALDHFWNRYMSRDKRVILIICGSAASWMIKKVINNKGGLYGRITREIRLLPFNLQKTETFLHAQDIKLDRKQIIDIYMAMGGVPKYLSYITRGKSATQIINNICFANNGPLFKEFNKLYHSLFDGAERHIKIVRELAKKRAGLTLDEILATTKLSSGGSFSMVINELEESGFITYIPEFSKRKKGGRYRLADEYSLFYLTWIDTLPQLSLSSIDQDYWLKQHNTAKYAVWSGYSFENVCCKHVVQIKRALGLAAVSTRESSWVYRSNNDHDKGAQIDLLIDRADNCINLCEIKFYNKKFITDKQYADNLISRKNIFIDKSQTKKSVFTTLITTYGAEENQHYLRAVDNQLTMNELFIQS